MARSAVRIPKYKRQRRRSGSVLWRILRFLFLLVLAFLLISVVWVLIYKVVNPPITATMAGDMIEGRGARRDWMPITQIDRDMVRAAIAAEDSKFCSHQGFDVEAIEDAMKRNASGGRIRGGSTITQQTAKNVFLWQGGGYPRKGVEAWFAFLIEKLWGRRRIMEVYLNVAETGIGTYGVNAGAQRYYGHDADAMSRTEAARIAAVLPLPKARGAVAPKGFTRRYGNTIVARIPVVARDGLDACIYRGTSAPADRAPPPTKTKPVSTPGADYETTPPQRSASEVRPVPEPVPADPQETEGGVEPTSVEAPEPSPEIPLPDTNADVSTD